MFDIAVAVRFTGDSVSGKGSGVRADASLKVWSALLLSPFAHSLFPVCHRLPSCHLYFSVRSVGLWQASVSFLEMTVSTARPHNSGSCSSGMLGHGEWHMPCVCSKVILQVSLWDLCIMPTCLCLWFRPLICAQVWFKIVKNWAKWIKYYKGGEVGRFTDIKGWNLLGDLLK